MHVIVIMLLAVINIVTINVAGIVILMYSSFSI